MVPKKSTKMRRCAASCASAQPKKTTPKVKTITLATIKSTPGELVEFKQRTTIKPSKCIVLNDAFDPHSLRVLYIHYVFRFSVSFLQHVHLHKLWCGCCKRCRDGGREPMPFALAPEQPQFLIQGRASYDFALSFTRRWSCLGTSLLNAPKECPRQPFPGHLRFCVII